MTFDANALAGNIRALRARKDVSQHELARSCGLTASTVVRCESGKCNPTISTVLKLAAGLGVSINDLLQVAA